MGDDLVEPDADTGLAPTSLAAPIDGTEVNTAWALDYDDPDETPTTRFTPRRITALGIAASLLVIAAAAGVILVVLREQATHGRATSIDSVAKAGSSGTYVKPPPPPAPVTVTKTRTVAAPVETVMPTADELPPPLWTTADDMRFNNLLAANGWSIWNAKQMADNGHYICTRLRMGDSPAYVVTQLHDITETEAVMLVQAARHAYPNCP